MSDTETKQTVSTTIPTAVSAMGIGVSDLQTSAAFYRDLLGMRPVMDFKLAHMDEIILVAPLGGSAIVLMHWTDGSERNYKNLPIKIVVRTPDPAGLVAKIRDAGYTIVRDAVPAPEVGNAIVGFARDPDGYLIEILEPLPSAN